MLMRILRIRFDVIDVNVFKKTDNSVITILLGDKQTRKKQVLRQLRHLDIRTNQIRHVQWICCS